MSGYTGRRHNCFTLTIIIAAHVAALAALALAKTEFVRAPDKSMETRNIPIDPPPPPEPVVDRKIEPRPPQSTSVLTTIKPVIPTPTQGPVITPTPTDDFVIIPGPVGPETIVPQPGPIIEPRVDPVLPPKPRPVALTPRGNPAAWVTNDDYPDAALRAEEQGRTAFTLAIGPDGKPTGCAVTASSGSARLDKAACGLLMRRARFVAGTDAYGERVGGTYTNSFRWTIPQD